MEVTYKKDINHTYIVFQGEKINTQTYQVQMILHNMVEGLLPCSMLCMDEEEVWRCECTGLQSLDDCCKVKELGKDDFIWVIHQLLENIQELQDYLLDVNGLYLRPTEVYVHPEKMRLLCCIVPFCHKDIWCSLREMLQFLLQYLDPEDNEVASLAYGFFRALSKEDCSMEVLWSVLYEKQRKWKTKRGHIEENTISRQSDGSLFHEYEAASMEGKQKRGQKILKKLETEKNIVFKDNKNDITQDDVDDRDALLDTLFYKGKDRQDMQQDDVSWKDKVSKDFLKKIAYLFPAVAAIFLFLYLVFHSWTMSETTLITYAVIIVVLQVSSLILYRKWGRDIKEINPLLEMESVQQEKEFTKETGSEKKEKLFGRKGASEPEEGTVYLEETPKKKSYLVRSDTGEKFELKQRETIIGKNKEKAQILLMEPAISRIHAMITKTNHACYIQDLNSKNGTYINGERLPIRTNTLLRESDELYMANIRFHLQL